MQASVPADLRWRVDLYARCFEFCRTGRFSLARFLALVPDRLRLAAGEAGFRVRIPVAVEPRLLELWRDTFRGVAPAAYRPKDSKELRRVLRIAQLDPELDPRWVLAWLRERGDPMLASLAGVYRCALAEIGRGEGGEEAAYLVHILTTEYLRLSIPADALPLRLLALAMIDLAQRALLESEELDPAAIPARLGYLFQATLSPPALGAPLDRLARRHLNYYRTNQTAVDLVRRVIQEPIEMIPLPRVVDTVARRLAVDPAMTPLLSREALLDRMRDASMLALLGVDSPPALLVEICRSEQALIQHLLNERRKTALLEAIAPLAGASPKAIPALIELLSRAPEMDVEERAELAATGAVALVMDTLVEQAKRDVTAMIQEVPESEWEAGRAYRLSLEEAPLHRLERRAKSALLYLDLSEVTPKRRLHASIAELAEKTPGVALVRDVEEALAFRGEVAALLELATAVERVVRELSAELTRPPSEILGGRPGRLEDAERELAALDDRIEAIDAALRRTSDRESLLLLADSRSLLERQSAVLRELAAASELRVPMFVDHGDVSEEAGRRGTGRCEWIAAERDAALQLARRARVSVAVDMPFFASIRRRARLDLPADLVRELDDAVRRSEAAHVATVTSKMTQWLRGEIERRASSAALLAGWTDPPYEIHSRGILVSEDALGEWRRAKRSVLRFSERVLAANDIPDELSRRWVLDRDPERLLLAQRAEERGAVAIFRYVGEATLRAGHATHLWELIRNDSEFVTDLLEGLRC